MVTQTQSALRRNESGNKWKSSGYQKKAREATVTHREAELFLEDHGFEMYEFLSENAAKAEYLGAELMDWLADQGTVWGFTGKFSDQERRVRNPHLLRFQEDCLRKNRRLEIGIRKYTNFCGVYPEDFDKNDVKLVSERAGVALRYTHEYLEYWYG